MPRVMEIDTPLGADVLLFHGMHAREELGRLSEFQVDLLSAKGDIDLDDILGKNVTVQVNCPTTRRGTSTASSPASSQGGKHGRYHRYRAAGAPVALVPDPDGRLPHLPEEDRPGHHQEGVRATTAMADVRGRADRHLREVDLLRAVPRDRLQLRQPADGAGGHLLLLPAHRRAQHAGAGRLDEHAHAGVRATRRSRSSRRSSVVRPEVEHITDWDFAREVQPGVYVHDDYDFERPSVELQDDRRRCRAGYTPSDYEVYDYPGDYVQKAGRRAVRERPDRRVAAASSRRRRRRPTRAGVTRRVACSRSTDYPRDDQNREYLIVVGDLRPASSASTRRCRGRRRRATAARFAAMSERQQFRPRARTPKPIVQGPQTAVVVGPAGEEIYTDKYGRVKVQFHWDREGKKDENSSCWIRVSQPVGGQELGRDRASRASARR